MPKGSRDREKDRGGKNRTPLILLGLAAAVVALTVFLVARRDSGPGRTDGRAPAASDPVRRVLARSQGLIASGDAQLAKTGRLSPNGMGPESRLARAAYEGARDLMISYIRAHPEDVEVRPILAGAYYRLGQYAEAEAAVEEVLRRAPESAEARWVKGQLLQRRGEDGYRQHLQAAADSPAAGAEMWSRYGAWLLTAGDVDAARTYLRRAYDAGLRDTATLSALGRTALAANQFEDAERLLDEAARNDPENAEVLVLLAETRMNLGKADQAARDLKKALKVARGVQQRAELLLRLGQVRQQQNQWTKAAETFVAAAEYRPFRDGAAFKAAQCYYFAERYALAMKYIDLVAEARGADPAVRQWAERIEDARFGTPRSRTDSVPVLPPVQPPEPTTFPWIDLPPFGR